MAKVNISKMLKKAEDALNRRNYDLAIFSYIQALQLQPENIDARTKLRATQTRAASERGGGGGLKTIMPRIGAKWCSLRGKHEEAMIQLENAITWSPSSLALLTGLADEAEKAEFIEVAAWQRQLIADRTAPDDIPNLFALASLYEEMGKGAEAINCYEKIQSINPGEDVGGKIRNASAIMTTDVFQTGVKEGSHAIVKDKDEAEFLELDAGNLKTDEQRKRAVAYLMENDVAARPDDHRLYIRLGDIYYDMNDWATGYAEAKKNYEKAIELNASDSTPRDKLGDLEIKRLRNDLAQLRNKLKSKPQDKAIKQAYQKTNKERILFETKEYERRVKAQPLKALFHFHLGELYFQAKRYDEAISELQQASRDPKHRLASCTMLGRSFHAMEQYDMAIDQYEDAMAGQELFSKIRDPLYYEALAYEAQGGKEALTKALSLYTKIYKTDINFKDVKEKVPALQKKLKDGGA